jgi:two-component system, NtrC family, response regulator AtoC
MSEQKINIKVYSDIEDVSSIISSVKQLSLKIPNINYSFPKTFQVLEDDIIILQLKDVESKHLTKLIEARNSIRNKIIFVSQSQNALLISSIAKLGFSDIFVFPFELYKFIAYLEEIITNKLYKSVQDTSPLQTSGVYDFSNMIGASDKFLRVLELSKKVSEKSDVNVLILGETGTGKGMLARAIHMHSKGAAAPFVDIVCTAIPESLLESELFGYEPGAFTNAKSRKLGLFELAENGSLFLDEIGDLSLGIQTKLLRTIEKKVIRRLGGVSDIPINARIISATNRNIEQLIEENLFRRDLYHRLNVVSLELPPLNERGDDILMLAEHFIVVFNKQFNKSVKKIDDETREFLMNYNWPGNLREFRNVMERAVLLSESSTLTLGDFSTLLSNVEPKEKQTQAAIAHPHFIRLDVNYRNIGIKDLEKIYAKEVLEKTNGNKSQAAKFLGISRPKLDSLLS